jgi:hypothetical protein
MSIFDQVWFQDIFPSILSKLTEIDQTVLYFTSKSLRRYKLSLCRKRKVCAYAARGGHLDLLKWARKNGCLWNSNTCTNAARGGHLELLKWARENGCPWDSNVRLSKSNLVQKEVIEWCTSQALEFVLLI